MGQYETGATSHAINDLILFADNTRELVKIRDEIYMQGVKPVDNDIIKSHLSGYFGNGEVSGYSGSIQQRVKGILKMRFNRLFYEAIDMYKKEFPDNHYQTRGNVGDNVISYDEQEEFCQLYADDFDNWKLENSL
jgi:hypothetical protein